ncbi:GDSL esterase/lipase At5g45910-like [Vicia villosa]|uniref:GDSL esterase/lipase At5g45910-like n=1 Tax=Vicia villosa TaxID=3911 RepID=UPI00273C713C|nr:GDSL esterase/lipase At5g45910-like [Vicia villosa]
MNIFILFSITLTCIFLQNVVLDANSISYEAFFNFGDSISDTGNAATTFPPMSSNSPYGSTYFKHPSGRLSNGRLIIDFIAEAYGLPFLSAYLNISKDQDIKKGVNFAFAGATALDVEYYVQNGLPVPDTINSLKVQLGWFKKLKPTLCESKEDCNAYFKKSLFIVGEIGGNDVFKHMVKHKTVIEIREIVPSIVEAIINTTNMLIEEGAVELAVPGNFPLGCNAGVLTSVNSKKKEDYDEFWCLIAYNNLVEYFNEQLKNSLETLRHKYPEVKIIYFDYYNDAKRLYQNPKEYGFIRSDIVKVCCGGGGGGPCGTPSARVCSDPSKRINWDGPHLTEAAYKLIAKGLVEGPFSNPSLKPSLFKIA